MLALMLANNDWIRKIYGDFRYSDSPDCVQAQLRFLKFVDLCFAVSSNL